jgi:hypothetical protein
MEKYPNKIVKMVANALIGMIDNNVLGDNGCEGFVGWCEDGDIFDGTEEEVELATELMRKVADKVDDLTYGWMNTDGFGMNEGNKEERYGD